MPRAIRADETFTDLRGEIDFTEGRLEDESLDATLIASVAACRARVAETEKIAQDIDAEEAKVDAARQGANLALDAAVTDFADDLLKEVDKNRDDARWRGHFRNDSVSSFNRSEFAAQVTTVRGWLAESKTQSMEAHRAALEAATSRAERAIARQNALATRRTNLWQAREELARFLTQERDTLHDNLSSIGRERKLQRGWPDSFFRKRSERTPKPTTPPTPTGPTTPGADT